MVGRVTVGQQLVRNEEIAFLADNRRELLAVPDVRHKLVKRVIETFRVVI
jgi:hypothetical protein